MSEMREMTLYGGPLDGCTIEILPDHLITKPMIGVHADDGEVHTYGLDDEGKFVWLPDPDDPKVQRGWFVFDDEGNLISEEGNIEDAFGKLDAMEDQENWGRKFGEGEEAEDA